MRILLLLILCFYLVHGAQAISPDDGTDTLYIFESIDGEVVMSAENYSFKGGAGGVYGTWALETDRTGYYDEGYMQSSLDKPADNSHLYFNSNTANLNYVINFNDTGTYYVHLRTLAVDHTENGFFATIDGEEINYGGTNPDNPSLVSYYIFVQSLNKWWWYTDGGGAEVRELDVSFYIPDSGQHTFTIYRRDLDSKLDHIWLTKHCNTSKSANHINIPDESLFIVYEKEGTAVNRGLKPESKINIYPNPAQTKLTIESNQKDNCDMQLEIMTITGNTVFTDIIKSNSTYTANLTSFIPGTYLLKVTGKEGCYVKKIIKVR